MSSTLRATTSQPRNLLSMARLNKARSRVRWSIWSLVRIAQTCFCRSGGLAPISFPLFQGVRPGAGSKNSALSCIIVLLRLQRRTTVFCLAEGFEIVFAFGELRPLLDFG